ncbi:MAG: hypothetical protein GF347_03950 [Candidatus Moranbacteria bacterium]|nr:hypothetical protein [Candidatus Moranbacteria bacterium]
MEEKRNKELQKNKDENPRVKQIQEDYFKSRPKKRNPMLKKRKNRRLNQDNWISYAYWILGGLAAISIIYVIGNLLTTKGVAARLIFQEGPVYIRKGPDAQEKQVDTDTKLKKRDQVITREGGRAIVKFEDGSLLRLKEQSRIILSADGDDIIILQSDGSIYHRVARKEKGKYKVRLTDVKGINHPTIEALGTAFWTERTSNSAISVGVVESKVKYYEEDNQKNIEVDEGEKINITPDKKNKTEITSEDLSETFLNWNIQQDEKMELSMSSVIRLKYSNIQNENQFEDIDQEEENPTDSLKEGDGTITLEAAKKTNGIELTWEVQDVEAPDGFKVLKGPDKNPSYPGNSFYHSIKSSSSNSFVWEVTDGKSHHFRVCIVDASKDCEIYSNDVEITAEKSDEQEAKENCEESDGSWDEEDKKCDCPSDKELENGKCVEIEDEDEEEDDDEEEEDDIDYAESISLEGSSPDEGEAKLEWSISGGEAPDGFIIVRDDDKNPSYPQDKKVQISDEDDRKYTWEDLEEGETYHFRICAYNSEDDVCEVYSNDIEVEIEK